MENPSVIFEDDYILALNKPIGWVVNDAVTAHGNPILQDFVSKNFVFPISNSKELRNGIVHRLDKPTSGVILVAKTKEMFEMLQKEFFDREVKKTYIALVHGKMEKKEGTIDAPIARLPWKRTKFGIVEGGRNAVTKYKVINSNNDYSLVELYPQTGRTHQLRVHLKHINHPIVGDHLYAGRKLFREDEKKFGRLMLHAKSIEFIHPITNKVIKLEVQPESTFKSP